MPRERVIDPDGLFHITSHAVGTESLLSDRIDATRYLDRAATVCARDDVECLMFCLLGTHVHLLLRPASGDLSTTMQWLNGGYSKEFNRRHFRRGALFAARYDSVHVETQEHLLEVIRYIALNPVKPGACARAEDWPWSSYGSLIGVRERLPFVADRELLLLFGRNRRRAIERIREFVALGLDRPRLAA